MGGMAGAEPAPDETPVSGEEAQEGAAEESTVSKIYRKLFYKLCEFSSQ